MDPLNERMRLKDRIIANIAKAVKSVQEVSLLSGDGTVATVTLNHTDWQCQKLCEHLDHALLHGLRHITPGYWKVVTNFTTKEAVKEIKRLRHVTTDLGRGRAWLFMSLNENLLESYIRCYQQNVSMVKKYYVKDALVLDQQGLNVILTLTSGLENTAFQLDIDLPYLDLSTYPPKSRHYSDSLIEEDRVSLCSMDSVTLHSNKPLPQSIVCNAVDSGRAATDSDSASIASCDTASSGHHRYSPSIDSGCHGDWNGRQRSVTPTDTTFDYDLEGRSRRFDALERLGEDGDVKAEDEAVEVIRVVKKHAHKSHKTKKKKSKKGHPKSSVAVIADIDENLEIDQSDVDMNHHMESSTENFTESLSSSTDTSFTSHSKSPVNTGRDSVVETKTKTDEHSNKRDDKSYHHTTRQDRDSGIFTEPVVKGGEIQEITGGAVGYHQTVDEVDGGGDKRSKMATRSADFYLGFEQETDVQSLEGSLLDRGKDSLTSTTKSSEKMCNDSSPTSNSNVKSIEHGLPRGTSFTASYKEALSNEVQGNLNLTNQTSGQVERAKTPNQISNNSDKEHVKSPTRDVDNSDNLVEKYNMQGKDTPENCSDFADSQKEAESMSSLLQNRVEQMINNGPESHMFIEEEEEEVVGFNDVVVERDRSRSLCEGEVEMDNNSMLFVMLDILDGDETFIKMFCTRQGHNGGETKVVFLLISSRAIYVLRQLDAEVRFSKEAVIPFPEIDYVSLGMNNQVIHIAGKRRRHQYWFTTGEERCTIGIVDCLKASYEQSELDLTALEVDTGATTQKITLKKYICKECQLEMSEANIICYSLVHWEDPSNKQGTSTEWDREGHLLYKSYETANLFGAQSWKSAFARLKDGMLCFYQTKTDSKPLHFLQMGGDHCVGCKRDLSSDKPHSIKIMQADMSSWSIALASELEANSWLQALCQAVSQGLQMSPARSSCVPCCMIVTQQKLLMCHEDLETNFVRTLGSANLLDITAVLTNDLNNFYILAFDSHEANVSSEKWVLYFNSQYEGMRFIKALSTCWSQHYQVEVPLLPVDDITLQKKCLEMAVHLESALTLKT